jgi:hypothetical protein
MIDKNSSIKKGRRASITIGRRSIIINPSIFLTPGEQIFCKYLSPANYDLTISEFAYIRVIRDLGGRGGGGKCFLEIEAITLGQVTFDLSQK